MCPSPNLFVEALTPTVILFGDRTYEEVTKINCGLKSEVLVQYDYILKRGRNIMDAHAQRKGHVSTQWEVSHLKARERDLRRNLIF